MQTLANLKSRITAATSATSTSATTTPMRIANVSGLGQYYREIGACGDITPDDGSTETFTPSQPPLDNNGWTERCVTGVGWG